MRFKTLRPRGAIFIFMFDRRLVIPAGTDGLVNLLQPTAVYLKQGENSKKFSC
jgi:hypothetical protein